MHTLYWKLLWHLQELFSLGLLISANGTLYDFISNALFLSFWMHYWRCIRLIWTLTRERHTVQVHWLYWLLYCLLWSCYYSLDILLSDEEIINRGSSLWFSKSPNSDVSLWKCRFEKDDQMAHAHRSKMTELCIYHKEICFAMRVKNFVFLTSHINGLPM